MQRIYSPWRAKYFSSHKEGCVFCNIATNSKNDVKNHVIYRDKHCFGVMNLYPYSPGHFMLIPHTHLVSIELLEPSIWAHISSLFPKACKILNEYGAKGINVGINIKQAGGAGIPEHLHIHFVPRYIGDTNFITSIGDTRIYGVDFEEIYNKILKLANKHFKNFA